MSAKNTATLNPSNKRLSSPMVSLKKLAKSTVSTISETYDFKAPKLVPASNKTPLKIKTSVRASIENLLVQTGGENPKDFIMNKVPYQQDSHRAAAGDFKETSFNDPKELKDSTILKDSNGRPDLKDLKDQKDVSSIIDSPLNSYKGSFLENTNEGASPDETKARSGSFKRASSSFDKNKLSTTFFGKNNKNIRGSLENSPSKNSAKSNGSMEKKVFNFNEKNSPTPNASFIKEKNEKEGKNSDGGLIFYSLLYCFLVFRMRVITEENEDLNKNILKPLMKPLEKVERIEKISPAVIPEQVKVFIPDSKAYKPLIRGISPKYFHEQTVKKIDDNKRTGEKII